jgi:hypothetical protein
MIHGSHHPDIAARVSLGGGSKDRRPNALAPLLASLILLAAIVPAAATPTTDTKLKNCNAVLKRMVIRAWVESWQKKCDALAATKKKEDDEDLTEKMTYPSHFRKGKLRGPDVEIRGTRRPPVFRASHSASAKCERAWRRRRHSCRRQAREKHMIHGSHHPDIAIRASLGGRWNARRPKPLALLMSGLILIAAIAPAAAERASCESDAERASIARQQMCWAKVLAAKQAAAKAKADAEQKDKDYKEKVRRQGFR